MIDHITVSVMDFANSKEFYVKVLGALGYTVKRDFPQWKMAGFGDARKPYFWLKESQTVTTPQHIAFIAVDRAGVDAFHQAALDAGAKDDGPPGVREHYHPNYYGAFVIDPFNGHPIEAVCHAVVVKGKAAGPAKKGKARKPAPKAKKKAKR